MSNPWHNHLRKCGKDYREQKPNYSWHEKIKKCGTDYRKTKEEIVPVKKEIVPVKKEVIPIKKEIVKKETIKKEIIPVKKEEITLIPFESKKKEIIKKENELFNQVIQTFINYSTANYKKLTEMLGKDINTRDIGEAYQLDLYITPPHCLNIINNWIDRYFNEYVIPENKKIKILDPAFGFGSLVFHIINKYSEYVDFIDAYEINETTLKISEKIYQNEKVNLHHQSFIEADVKNDYYDLVLMNPPFRASINGTYEKIAWIWFLIKAMQKAKDELIIISPMSTLVNGNIKNNEQFYIVDGIPDATRKRIIKDLNLDTTIDAFEVDLDYSFKLGECTDFLSIVKGKSTKTKINTWIALFKKSPYGSTFIN